MNGDVLHSVLSAYGRLVIHPSPTEAFESSLSILDSETISKWYRETVARNVFCDSLFSSVNVPLGSVFDSRRLVQLLLSLKKKPVKLLLLWPNNGIMTQLLDPNL